jgi:flagellar basal-body rod modification protein FlgD
MTHAISGSSNGGTQSGQAAAPAPAIDKNMFLELLVAQLQNQDPMNPTDGTQFVGQLAQFQQLEQSVNMGSDISAMRQDLDQLAKTGSGS